MNTLPLIQFAEDDSYTFDRELGVYRDKQTGKELPRTKVFQLVRQAIDRQKKELVSYADQIASGDMSLLDFQLKAAFLIRRIHVQSAVLGKGGIEKMEGRDWLEVGRELNKQFYSGRDPETRERFGLRSLATDIKAGNLSAGRLRNSLSLFAESGKASYWRALRAANRDSKPFAYRKLGKAEHCEDCLKLSRLPPQPIDQIVLPTQNCACLNNCKCQLIPVTLEQAIARGMRVSNQEEIRI